MEKLLRYKPFLDKFTADSALPPLPGEAPAASRYDSFKFAFEHFQAHYGRTIVELGTIRSFVHGGHVGCNSDDPKYWTPDQPENWDWGAGCFSRLAAECLAHMKPDISTIDLSKAHIERCKVITAEFNHLFTYKVCEAGSFLSNAADRPKGTVGIDLLYLDTGDMTPIEHTARQQLLEAKRIVEGNVLSDDGILLIDDVKNSTPEKFGETSRLGKSKYSLPYLLENGYEVLFEGYQCVLGRKK